MRALYLGLALAFACAIAFPSMAASVKPAAAPVITSPIQAIQAFTVSDLQNALADAQANSDVIAAACYTALIPVVQQQANVTAPTGKIGAISVFQKSRDLARLAQRGVPDSINMACSPLVLDAQTTVLRLGALAGLAVPAIGPLKLGVTGAIMGATAATAALPK